MYYNEEIEEIYKKLDSNKNGLTEFEVNNRLKTNGKNILPHKKRPSVLKLFINEFSSPIELILIFTVIISFIVGEVVDALVITFIILVDTIMGTYQENKALNSAESLSNMIKSKSKVLRNGKECSIDSMDLVIGDIILLESGDRINADARIIEANNFQVDESILTGESTTIYKNSDIIKESTILSDRKNMVYAGSSVITGRAKAIVVATSASMEIGKIAKQVEDMTDEKTPLTIRMEKFTKQISVLIVFIAIISSIILFINGYEFESIFLSVVALAISAMPEGLPLALTMALTIASNRMSKKNVIVKNLSSVEALGSCTVIASDKTGTLTVNEQTARIIVLKNGSIVNITGTGYNNKGEIIVKNEEDLIDTSKIINLCALNNEAHFDCKEDEFIYYGDSIDVAFLALKSKFNTSLNYKIEKIIPYESEKQYSAAFYKDDGKLKCTVKGSIEKVLEFSNTNEDYIKYNDKLSKEGYRVIAVCDGYVNSTKEESIKSLEFLGLVAFIDPVREEVKKSILECHNAGINVIMITGDHPNTALAIAKELSIASSEKEVITGRELELLYKKDEKYFDEVIKDKKVFSRVTPTDKLNIVESLKRRGEFVAVTGDGVNDAPAIKAANIGVAMGSGTDVAMDTSDMIIIDDNFTSIVEGIKEGRVAYSNIRKIILFLLSCGIAEVLFYLFSVCLGYELPLVAIQLLWLNLVTDGLQDVALSFEKESDDIMMLPPRKTTESLFSKDLFIEVSFFGIIISLIVFTVWKYLIDNNTDLLVARSIIMFIMVFIQNIHVLNCRSEKNSIFKSRPFSNLIMSLTIIGSIILQIIVIKVPFLATFLKISDIPFKTILICFMISLIIVLVSEIYKLIYRFIIKKKLEISYKDLMK